MSSTPQAGSNQLANAGGVAGLFSNLRGALTNRNTIPVVVVGTAVAFGIWQQLAARSAGLAGCDSCGVNTGAQGLGRGP